VFIILKQSVDTIKVQTDVSIDNQEDVIQMETYEVCVPQECEPEGGPYFEMIYVVVVVGINICVWFCTHGTTEIG
jgi:hypothetical protein